MDKSIEEYFIGLFPLVHKKIFKNKKLHGQTNRILFVIADHNGKPMKYYCDKLHISKPNMTTAVNGLIEENYLKRERDENDRRQINLYITEKGMIEVKNHKKAMLETIRERLAPLTNEDQQALKEHFIGIMEILNKLEE
ncbi:MAG: MarR family transcriptional regulator [Clostridia bacterium]|nr:MarR family transcriptional regulator [Clostridia bacterium]